ncbi:hypothetical protein EUGRSUZ_K01807 [Eucalyptus grandis]|uniref:Disease resistance protein winged helix domain-containing protein n=2 Tax=Eucalyptus grandis TaxID=71139 RepID=A0A059A2U7_EUCGR|nr:hypothetical protein EUGRSUZ_K01807 [Eucalyptus grandis]
MTTRNFEVACMMGTHPTHNLKGLSHEDSMVLFKKCAFDEKEREPCPKLLEIGKHIVEKSHGVPLLVKTLGCLLYTKHEEWYWAHIRDSETWNLAKVEKDIVPILKLSYDYLPSNLKCCFAALSLLRKDDEFDSTELAYYWMALGLISSTREKQALEDVIVENIKELWNRSLIQEVMQFGSLFTFKMHDLVHYLASVVAKKDYSIVGVDTAEISKGVRHVSFSSFSFEGISNSDGVPPFLRKPTSKRLLAITFGCKVVEIVTREFVRTCLSKCKQLRILHLPNGNLPKNMNRLVSLRYLLVTTKQNSLQESGIQYLENLRFLDIDGCENLQVLFEGTCQLTRLEHLGIENCGRPISFFDCSNLSFLPQGVRSLTALKELRGLWRTEQEMSTYNGRGLAQNCSHSSN